MNQQTFKEQSHSWISAGNTFSDFFEPTSTFLGAYIAGPGEKEPTSPSACIFEMNWGVKFDLVICTGSEVARMTDCKRHS